MAGGNILAFLIDIDRRPYNTLALSCECVIMIAMNTNLCSWWIEFVNNYF